MDAKDLKELSSGRAFFEYLMLSSLAFTLGLFWNDAVQSLINDILPGGSGTPYKFITAAILTIVVFLVYKSLNINKNNKNKGDEIVRKQQISVV